MQLSREFARVVQPLLDVHRSAAMGTSSGPAKSLPAHPANAQVPRPAKVPHSTQAKSPNPLQTIQPSPAGMGTDSSGAAYATPVGSMSDGAEPFDTAMPPMEDWAREMWQRVAPQLWQPGLKLLINTSTCAVTRASSTPSPQVPSG